MSISFSHSGNKPFLSIILPVYNVAQYLPRLMKSLLNPRLPHDKIEMIFVDDKSPDNSSEIIKEYAKTHSNIRLIQHIINKKQGGARNTGILESKGEYIFFADPDDEIIPDGMLRAIAYLNRTTQNLDIAMYDHVSSKKKTPSYETNNTSIMSGYEFLNTNEVYWAPWCCIFRRNFLIENCLFFEENVLFEDTIWSLRTLVASRKIQYFPIIIYYYHHNTESTCFSRKKSLPKTLDKWRCALTVSDFANWKQHPEKAKHILRSHGKALVIIATKALLHHSLCERNIILKTICTAKSFSIAQTTGGLLKFIIHHRYIANFFMFILSPVVSFRNIYKK